MDVRRPRVALTLVFLTGGVLFGTWAARIPAVKDRTGVSGAGLGWCLWAMAAGALSAKWAAGRLVTRYGSRAVCRTGVLLACPAVIPMAVADGPYSLAAALTAFGVVLGVTDVAMNAQALVLGRQAGRSAMSSLHAAYSVGGLTGAATGAWFAARGIAPVAHFALVAAALVTANAVCGSRLPASEPAPAGRVSRTGSGAPVPSGPSVPSAPSVPPVPSAPCGAPTAPSGERASAATAPATGTGTRPPVPAAESAGAARDRMALAVLALACLCGLAAEGATADWAAVHLHEDLGRSSGFAALGYAVYCVAMAVARLCGDRVTARWGGPRSAAYGAAAGAVLFGAALATGQATVTLAGFAALGAGLSLVVPTAIETAGRLRGHRPARDVAVVTAIGGLGFLAGPPVIGSLAQVWGLPAALTLVPLLTLAAAGLLYGPAAHPPTRPRRHT